VKIYPRILLNILPLILVGLLVVGGLTYYLSFKALTNLAEKWLDTKLSDATRVLSENVAVLHKYGLNDIEANVDKAKTHTGSALKMLGVGETGYIWAVDLAGRIVVHHDPLQVDRSVYDTEWFKQISGHLNGKFHNVNGEDKLLTVYKYFSPWNWYILASASKAELYGEANRMRGYILVVGLLSMLVTAIVLMILARRLTAPLHALSVDADRFGRGDPREIVPIVRGDEIGTLSTAFNRMTRQLNRRMAQEKLVSDISRRFIYLSSTDVDHAIQASLKQIGEYTDADRCYMGELSLVERRVGPTREWCRKGVGSQTNQIEGLSFDALPWFMQRMQGEGFILSSSIDDLPLEAEAEQRIWRQRGIQSVVRVPMTYGGELRGFVGLDAINQPKPWSQVDVSLLMRVGEIFCNTLERLWYQDSLASEKERLSVTLQSIGDGVITTDVEGKVVLINRVAEVLTGWMRDDAADRSIDEVFAIYEENARQRMSDPIGQVIQTGQTTAVPPQSLLIAKNGAERIIANSVAPIYEKENKIVGVVLVFRDITDKRRMQEEMLKVEKLESIGVLAGGIAHDFNNILTAIIGNISLTKHHMDPNSRLFAKMEEIERASFRARDLTQQLLTFAKGGAPIKKTISLNQLFYQSATFALGGSNVGLDYTPREGLWLVEADDGQMSQVINNLVINALQAMSNGGVIHADIENTKLSQDASLPLPAGRYVKLSIKDHGSGISKENLTRVFDPFFTTKKKGSGLGLATAYAIIEKHGGHITVESTKARGTVFEIYLPASDREAVITKPVKVELISGDGKILVMDDEQILREVVGEILTKSGYRVEFAVDGQQMLDVYENAIKKAHPFDAVIMDLTIPGGMGGKEAIAKLLKLDPHAKAIVSSGFSTDPVMSDFSHYGFLDAVSKPYRAEDICMVLKKILHSD
jgi:PAS domain S-box-containing protein